MKKKKIIVVAIVAIAVVITAFTILSPKGVDQIGTGSSAISATNEKGDIEIPISDITEKATFYSYDELDSKMEIIAVKASDGTIRTAFNTCQVCYSSGRGYYKQEGDLLVCQNCGNQFSVDQVEASKGGCNPVPIFDEQKQVKDDKIIIPKESLKEAEAIFQNWKI